MTLAPIRGAPPGAPIPDFPVEEPRVKTREPTVAPASVDLRPVSLMRRRHTPIEIAGGGIVLTFKVAPELPAIARASMTVHIVAEAVGSSAPQVLGFLRMSATNARVFLTDLRNGHSPIVGTGDEDGTVQIEYESTETGPVLSVCTLGEQDAEQRVALDRTFDLNTVASELLADLGV